jgi:hypothetical protein
MIRRIVPLAVLVALAAFALAGTATAAPIRVGILKGTGPGRYWHTNIHTASGAIASILANPSAAGFQSPVMPTQGVTVRVFGPDSGQCTGNNCGPTATQLGAFIAALDSLDVVVVSNFVGIGGTIVDTAHRSRFARFIRTKGLVSTHWSIDSYGSLPVWDTLHGARFQNKVSGDRYGTLHHDSAAMGDPAWRFLNRGLPDTARFVEEWVSFTTNSNTIRSIPGLKVTTNLSEASLSGGLGGMREMGPDHVYSWFREFQEGGRLFYTGLGHRAELFTGAPSIDSAGDTTRLPNHYLRRQLYNAILWAAGSDSNGVVSLREGSSINISNFSNAARLVNHGGVLAVSILQNGSHVLEIRALNGALVALRRGNGRADHRIESLRPGVYTVSVTAGGHTLARLITLP